MRVPDWSQKLSDYLQVSKAKPFVWGQHDCAIFCDGAVQAITGRSRLPAQLWRNRREAVKFILEHRSFEAALTAYLGPASTTLAQARRGDLALVQGLDRKWLGVVTGITVSACGNTHTLLAESPMFWKID